MKKRILLFILLNSVLSLCTVQAQISFSKISDFGHMAIFPFGIYEKDNVYYSKGINIKSYDTDDGKYNLFFAKQNFKGDSLLFSYYPQEESIFSTNLSKPIVEHDNKLYTVTGASGEVSLFSYDMDSEDIVREYKIGGLMDTLYLGTDLIEINDTLVVLINMFNNNESHTIVQYVHEDKNSKFLFKSSDFFIAKNILNINDTSLMIVGYSGIFDDLVLNLLEIDLEGNILYEYTGEYGYPYTGLVVDALYTDEGNFVISGLEQNPSDKFSVRPYVYQVDRDENKQWELNLGDHIFTRFGSNYTKVVESIEGDGYVFAGNAWYYYEPQDSLINLAHLAKLDKEGAEVWFRTYAYLEGNATRHLIEDMVKTSDGGYAMIGSVQCGYVNQDGTSADPDTAPGTPCRRSLLIKVNAEGLIDSNSLNVPLLDSNIGIIKAYPNPVDDYLFIETTLTEDVSIFIISAAGQIIKELNSTQRAHSYILDTSTFSSGMYTILIKSRDGRSISRRVVKI